MDVLAFTGPPGSGKSDRALVVAYENKASCIIDDGILIYHNRIVAGKSAKREASRLTAVRRALFWDSNQAEDVIFHIMKINPERILILGTSDRMVQKIAATLKLPAPSRYIHIEDVAKPEEIAQANYARHKEGKHVIPVPTMELRPYFKGIFISEEMGADKPSKAFFDACFAAIPGFRLEETVMVGDSLTSDIRGGSNAGLRTVWFNPHGKEPRADIRPGYTIRALSELLPLLGSMQ